MVQPSREKSRAQERSESQIRSGAEIGAVGLAGAEIAELYKHRKAKEDREEGDADRKAELASISKRQVESIPADDFTIKYVNEQYANKSGFIPGSRLGPDEKASFSMIVPSVSGNELGTPVLPGVQSLHLENAKLKQIGLQEKSENRDLEGRYSGSSVGSGVCREETSRSSCYTPLTDWLDEEVVASCEVVGEDLQSDEEDLRGNEETPSHNDQAPGSILAHDDTLHLEALYGELPRDTDESHEIDSPYATPSDDGCAQKSECGILQEDLKSSESHSQSSSITESTLLDDTTDWGEESDLESYDYRNGPGDQAHLLRSTENSQGILKETLEPMKREMVDRLMAEFWIIFKQKWQSGTRECGAASRKSTSTSGSAAGSKIPAVTQTRENAAGPRGGGGQENENPDENFEKDLGGSGNPPASPSNTDQTAPGFACPYRKRNPRKYCVRDWRACALSPLRTVARVK